MNEQQSILTFSGTSLSFISFWCILLFSWLSRLSGFSGFSWFSGSSFSFFFGLLSFSSFLSTLNFFFLRPLRSIFSISFSFTSLVVLLLNFSGFDFKVSSQFIEDIFSISSSQHILSFGINSNLINLDLGFFGDPIQSSFSFFFLYFQRNALDWTFLNSLHKMCGEPSNLISQSFGGDFCNFREDSLVDMEIRGKFLIVFFQQDLCGSFDCFCSNSTHVWLIII